MFKLIKTFIFIIVLIASFTVPLGHKTLYEHLKSIWNSSETKELKTGVKQKYSSIQKTIKTNNINNIKKKLIQKTLPNNEIIRKVKTVIPNTTKGVIDDK